MHATVNEWEIVLRLLVAVFLCAIIGFEREIHGKSAGLRTHALVGLGAALFMIVSQFGFSAVLDPGRIVLDPSRVAAQVVSGVGFLGGGLIVVRRDSVIGLTTAAGIWVSAAVGLACGAGLFLSAASATLLSVACVLLLHPLATRLSAGHSSRTDTDQQADNQDNTSITG